MACQASLYAHPEQWDNDSYERLGNPGAVEVRVPLPVAAPGPRA